jgi:hypothetical protein
MSLEASAKSSSSSSRLNSSINMVNNNSTDNEQAELPMAGMPSPPEVEMILVDFWNIPEISLEKKMVPIQPPMMMLQDYGDFEKMDLPREELPDGHKMMNEVIEIRKSLR